MNAQQQAALVALGQAALAGSSFPALLDQAVRLVAATLAVDSSSILELLPCGSTLILRAGAGGVPGGAPPAVTESTPDAPAGYVILTHLPVLVEDWRTERRFRPPAPLRDRGVISSLCVSIPGQSRPFGVLSADSTQPGAFGADATCFLEAMATVLGMAHARSQVLETLERRVAARARELERRHQVAERLHDILTILNSRRSVDEILNYIITQTCQLLDTAVGAIYRIQREEGLLEIRAAHGLSAVAARQPLPLSWGVVRQVVVERQPVAITDVASALPDAATPLPARQELECLTGRYRALLAVPIVIKDEVYGALALYYPESRTFAAEDIRLAVAAADQTALALENARLVATAQGQAVLEERQRLARDLHDSVAQALYGIRLYTEAAARMLEAGDVATVAGHLRELQDTAQEALQEMRLLIFELRPPVLEQEGLVPALQARLEAVEGRSNLRIGFVVAGEIDLPAPVEQALYRIAQEALNNILRHAHARNVAVSLRREGPGVTLEIVDDGIGFDPAAAARQGGLGLRGIAERVAQLGGRLTVQSAPGARTQVQVEVLL